MLFLNLAEWITIQFFFFLCGYYSTISFWLICFDPPGETLFTNIVCTFVHQLHLYYTRRNYNLKLKIPLSVEWIIDDSCLICLNLICHLWLHDKQFWNFHYTQSITIQIKIFSSKTCRKNCWLFNIFVDHKNFKSVLACNINFITFQICLVT